MQNVSEKNVVAVTCGASPRRVTVAFSMRRHVPLHKV